MKTKLMALEALNGMIDIAQMTMGGRTPFGKSLGLSDIPDDSDGPLPKAIRAISALEADIAQPVAPEWIPVDERLPNDDCHVLAATWLRRDMTQVVEVASFCSGGGYFNVAVTHWMALPSAPGAAS